MQGGDLRPELDHLYQFPEIVTRLGFPKRRESDSEWRTKEVLQLRINLGPNTVGQNHSASLGALRLMGVELNLATCLAALGCDISYRQGGNLSDSQSRIDGQDEGQSISLSMSRGLNDSKHPSDFRLGKD